MSKDQKKHDRVPHADAAKKNGAFDIASFMANLPAAKEAFMSGATVAKRIVIDQGHDGKPVIKVRRQHKHNNPGLPAVVVCDLMDVLAKHIQSGALKITQFDEHDTGDDHDELVIGA